MEGSSQAPASFQWGGTASALFLLLLNRTAGWPSAMRTNLLVLYLLTSFPTVLFKILRGQFGHWIACLAVAANLFLPQTFPVSRFILFVITPSWFVDGLRGSFVGGIFCLVIAILLVIREIQGIGRLRNCETRLFGIGYCLGIFFLFLFTILYLHYELGRMKSPSPL